MIRLIEICLEDWTYHYPTGCVIHFYDGERGEYCDTVEEYKMFLSEYKEQIVKDRPRVIFKIDMDDIDMSNVMDAVNEIKDFINELKG